MSERASNRRVFAAALAGVLAGLLVISMLPATAATGDPVLAGMPNQSGKATKLRSRGPSTLKLINMRPAGGVGLEVVTRPGEPPFRVNQTALVDNLNADFLDGWEGSTYLRDNSPESITAATNANTLLVQNPGAGNGIKGVAGTGGDGLVGQASNATKSGVYGHNNGNGYGVTGRGGNGFGVYAWGGGDASGTDAIGDLLLAGNRGEIVTTGDRLNLATGGIVNVMLDRGNDGTGTFAIWNGADTLVYFINEDGDTWSSGTKSAVVETQSHGSRLMYAVESPGVWFEDFGTAALVDGVAEVSIEPLFAETVNLEADYHVFFTPLGDCGGLYVAVKTPTAFEVRELGGGTASVEFDYRIVAPRLGYEDVRAEMARPGFEGL